MEAPQFTTEDSIMVSRFRIARLGGQTSVSRSLCIIVIAILLGVSVEVSVATPALATYGNEGCKPGRSDDGVTRHDGGQSNFSGRGGVWASIKIDSPSVLSWLSAWTLSSARPAG